MKAAGVGGAFDHRVVEADELVVEHGRLARGPARPSAVSTSNRARQALDALRPVQAGLSRQPNRDNKRTSRLVRSPNSFGVKKLPAARLLISPSVG
jgi:hypothetical protein